MPPPGSARSSHVSWAEPPVSARVSFASDVAPQSGRSSAAYAGTVLESWGMENDDDDDDVADGSGSDNGAQRSPVGASSAEPTWDFPAVASPKPQPRMEPPSRRSVGGALPAAAGVLAAAWRAANGETDADAPTPPPRDAASWQALPSARASMDRSRSSFGPVTAGAGAENDVAGAAPEAWVRPRSTRMAEFPPGFVPEPAAEPFDDTPPLLLPHALPPSPLEPRGSASQQGGFAHQGGVHHAVKRISEARRPDTKKIGLPPSPASPASPAQVDVKAASPASPAFKASSPAAAATPPAAARGADGVPADVAACFSAFHTAGDGADALRLRVTEHDPDYVYSAFGFLVSAEDTLTKVAVSLHAQRGWAARAHTALDADEAAAGDDDEDDDDGKTPAHNKLLWSLPLDRLEAAWWSADADDDELMLLDAAGSGGDARLLLPARAVAVGALAAVVARRGAALAAADTSDDPRRPWLGDKGPGGRQLQLLPASEADEAADDDDGDVAPRSPVAAAPAEESGSEEASTSDDSDDSDAGPRRPQWNGSGLRRS